jgi:type I restriction-modification system DNA methylase subunit
LIFLKYISDSFEELHSRLKEDSLSDEEDKDEYLAENVFFVPQSARFKYVQFETAKLPTISNDIDDAIDDAFENLQFNKPLILTDNITHLILNDCFNQPIQLNDNLVEIIFGAKFNQPIELNKKLKKLSFSDNFNQPIILNKELKDLEFGFQFNQPVELNDEIISSVLLSCILNGN